ncbi:MAG: hypothetical protein ABEL51_11760 [Salinibacter sp.]
MSGCPVHSSDDSEPSRSSTTGLRWDLIFLALAVSILAFVIAVALQIQ